MHPRGNARVWTWFRAIDDDQLRISPVVYLEMREGWERERKKLAARGDNTANADAKLAALDLFERDFAQDFFHQRRLRLLKL